MNRYISVNKFVCRVTENEALRTFFTLLLMSHNVEQRETVEHDFWQNVEMLEPTIKEDLMNDYRKTLPQLLQMTKDLRLEVTEYRRNVTSKAA
jgi:hypothetical protein